MRRTTPAIPARKLLLATAIALLPGACGSTPDAAGGIGARSPSLRFAILMYERDDAWNLLPAAEREALYGRYGAWIADLRSRGVFRDGTPIDRGGVVIAADARGTAVASPIDPMARRLTGIFVVETATAAEAEAIAATCPALLHGETVELRAIGHE